MFRIKLYFNINLESKNFKDIKIKNKVLRYYTNTT